MPSPSTSGNRFDEEYQKKRSLSCMNISQRSGLGLPIPTNPFSTSTRSVSTTVINESGAFEAANKFNFMSPDDGCPDIAQIQIKLKYSVSEEILNIVIEKARNLTALDIMEGSNVYVEGHLLPFDNENYPLSISTKPVSDLKNPMFCECFNLNVLKRKLRTKTLLFKVCKISDLCGAECLASAHVSLADYNKESVIKWYNLLSSKCEPEKAKMTVPNGEESTDDSTETPNKTSTLKRNEFDVTGPINSQMNNSSDNADEHVDDDDGGVEDKKEFNGTGVDDDENEKQIEHLEMPLNGIDSNSEMTMDRRDSKTLSSSFKRNSFERQPLRKHTKWSQTATSVIKTSLDPLLDQCAQKTRSEFALDGNEQPRKSHDQLQTTIDTDNKETAALVNEDPEYNEFVSGLVSKNKQEKNVNKIEKVERQIYNTRKSECLIKKEPDQEVTFTEKLNFFSKPPVIIPTLPSELSAALESVESSKNE